MQEMSYPGARLPDRYARTVAGGGCSSRPPAALDPAATAPNAGAWRLLHWLSDAPDDRAIDARLAVLNRHGVDDATVDRLIDGGLSPFEDMAAVIARATGGQVLPADWDAPGAAWDDVPAVRA